MEHHRVAANGIQLHVVTAGPADGEPVLLIHGFPETWYEWRHAIAEFEGDYHLIVPDTRGFGESDKPAGPYDRQMLAADLVGVRATLRSSGPPSSDMTGAGSLRSSWGSIGRSAQPGWH